MCEWEKGLRRRLENGDKAGRKEGEMVDGADAGWSKFTRLILYGSFNFGIF